MASRWRHALSPRAPEWVVTGHRTDILEDAVSRLGENAFAEPHDVTDGEEASALLERIEKRHGAPALLVNNAGTHVKRDWKIPVSRIFKVSLPLT